MKPTPVPVSTGTDEDITVYNAALLLFGWVRAGAELVAQAPDYAVDIAHELTRAWEDSGKPPR